MGATAARGAGRSSTVAEVMTQRVIALRPDADFKEIVAVLRQYHVSACPVIDADDRVVGVVSEADLLCKQADPNLPAGLIRLRWKLGEESKATAVTAGQLMTSPAVTVHAGASVVEAARSMQDHQVKRLPVIDGAGRLVGIVSRADLLSVYERPDSAIWEEVTQVIMAGDFGLDPADFDVTVSAGIVTFAGEITEDEALRLLARVRHAEGVVGVRDRFTVLGVAQHG